MKLKETLLNTADYSLKKAGGSSAFNLDPMLEQMGDMHVATNRETPLRADAFALTDEQKIDLIEERIHDILDILGMDLTDDSLSGTPRRVAKMYVKEIFKGLHPANMPDITLFENKFGYGHMLVERDITLKSYCEHHLVPIIGKVHLGYISNGFVIGLSKINRLVDYYARRPHVQERLTEQIAEALKKALKTEDVAVVVDADHFCVSTRGIQDQHSSTVTSHFSGAFSKMDTRNEFYLQVSGNKK